MKPLPPDSLGEKSNIISLYNKVTLLQKMSQPWFFVRQICFCMMNFCFGSWKKISIIVVGNMKQTNNLFWVKIQFGKSLIKFPFACEGVRAGGGCKKVLVALPYFLPPPLGLSASLLVFWFRRQVLTTVIIDFRSFFFLSTSSSFDPLRGNSRGWNFVFPNILA